MKYEDASGKEKMEDLWLDIGPAAAYEGLDCHERAEQEGDASPDGLRHGFEGAEPENLVAPPDDDPDTEGVPRLTPQLQALEGLDSMDGLNELDDVPPIDR